MDNHSSFGEVAGAAMAHNARMAAETEFADDVTRHTKALLERRTATLLTRAENAETDLDLIQDAARLHQQGLISTAELYAVIETREPAPVVITQDAAAHILAQEDLDHGYQPGRYIGCLLTAWRQADPDHAARLAAAYPVYGAAIALLNAPGGIEQLRAIATGEDTCRVLVIDGQPIRVHGGKEPTDQGRAALAEAIAAARRRYAAEHPDDVEGA
jgi:hypothetical protein